jgi:subtilisin family serine protease
MDEDSDRKKRELEQTFIPYIISPVLIRQFGIAQEAAAKETKSKPAPVRLRVILELNLNYPTGREGAKARIDNILGQISSGGAVPRVDLDTSRHHVFAELTLAELEALVREDHQLASQIVDRRGREVATDLARAAAENSTPAIYKAWLDRQLEAFLDRSVRIIKADVCQKSFGADGEGIVWAVADSGIEKDHPHFATFENLTPGRSGPSPAAATLQPKYAQLDHFDFTGENAPLSDGYGHGTHVAGIIAGVTPYTNEDGVAKPKAPGAIRIRTQRNEQNETATDAEPLKTPLQGVAPRCKLISLKVMNSKGEGYESALLAALDYVARINDDGRWPRIHGVNLSLGYGFEAEWYAAGQSPLCVAVDRLVSTGVVVVAAAGNDGSAKITPESSKGQKRIGLDQSITDPGNADRAITVGSTHPVSPHTFGVSFFSSRGPTADGRPKPDLVAPGERILSCASAGSLARLERENPELKGKVAPGSGMAFYREESGTSMAAPHVSGAIAAFLSIRSEFKGKPDRIKEIFVSSATDLKRKRDFQGAGLLDLLRAIQSV